MDALIEAIRTAVVPGATDETRAAGANACRTLLAALDARAGEPIAAPDVPPIAAAVAALRGMPPEQLLDVAIARLKAALPAAAEVAPVRSYQVPLVPLGPLAAKNGNPP